MPGILTRLNQILTFTAVAPGATVALAHGINVNGRLVKPDIVFRDDGDFSIVSVTTTTVTVKNNGANVATLNVWLWRQHTIDRAYGGSATTDLTPQPFIPAAGGGSSGVAQEVFRFTATGAEGSDFMVNLPVARAVDTYKVFGQLAGVTLIFGMDCPDILVGDRTTTQFRVVTTGAVAAGDQIDFLVTD